MNKRYFIDTDNSSHRYIIEADHKAEWDAWLNLPEYDDRSWSAPPFAMRIDGNFVEFENPTLDGKPLQWKRIKEHISMENHIENIKKAVERVKEDLRHVHMTDRVGSAFRNLDDVSYNLLYLTKLFERP